MLAAALGCGALLTGILATGGAGGASAPSAGSPDRGRTVYLTRGCGGCHDASPVGDERPAGPKLEVKAMTRNAKAAGLALGPYVLESIVAPRAFAVPGYVSGAMPSYAQLSTRELEDLVSYLIGAPFAATPAARIPKRPVAACDASARCRSTVARWRRVASLPASAVPGAKITAAADCLTCHRYAGSGPKATTAPDLTRQARRKRTLAWLVAKLRCPDCRTPASGMPSYEALGTANLKRVAIFLRASRGVQP